MRKVITLLFLTSTLSAASFHFKNFLHIRDGKKFQFYLEKNKDIKGWGIAKKITKNSLAIEVHSQYGGKDIAATIYFRVIKISKHKIKLRFKYQDSAPFSIGSINDVIEVDRYFASRGVFTFIYKGDKYFQLKRLGRQKSLLVLTWGRAILY